MSFMPQILILKMQFKRPLVFCVVCFVLFVILNLMLTRRECFKMQNSATATLVTFQEQVLQYSKDNLIILSTTDYFYLDLALNLHYTMESVGITNYIFGCTHRKACAELRKRNITTYSIGNVEQGEELTKFRSQEYNDKTYCKTQIVLEALLANVSVLFVDSDSVFLQDPTPYLKQYNSYDMAASMEYNKVTVNSGLYLANPTQAAIDLHKTMVKYQLKKNGSNQQIMNKLLRGDPKDSLKIIELDASLFRDGYTYFYRTRKCCSFAHDRCCPRSQAVILHNDWIQPYWRKVYRFREQLMWHVDSHGYYSSLDRKYLQMTFQRNNLSKSEQQRALENGFQVAALLNRTLILPKFHCKYKLCTLIELFIGLTLDSLPADFREHMFLQNPLVPEQIRNSATEPIHLEQNQLLDLEFLYEYLSKFEEYSVIIAESPHEIKLQFDQDLSTKLEKVLSQKHKPQK